MAYLGDTKFPLIVRWASEYNKITGVLFKTPVPESMELLILSYSVYSLSLISQQCWDTGYSRRVEGLFLLSGSKSVLVGSIAAPAVTCPPQQLWSRATDS